MFKLSEVLNSPLQTLQETHHDGCLPQEYSALQIDKENVVLTSMKQAEDGNGIIMRLVEVDGKATEATVESEALNTKFTMCWKPQEIKTVRITPDQNVTECLITGAPIN